MKLSELKEKIDSGGYRYFVESSELPYTTEELEYFAEEMRKFRLPKVTQLWKKHVVVVLRWTFLPLLIILTIFGLLYNSKYNYYGQWDWMWVLDKTLAFSYIGIFLGWTIVSRIFETISVNKLRKRLGLPKNHFRILVIAFQITGMD